MLTANTRPEVGAPNYSQREQFESLRLVPPRSSGYPPSDSEKVVLKEWPDVSVFNIVLIYYSKLPPSLTASEAEEDN